MFVSQYPHLFISSPTPISSGEHIFILWIYESVYVLLSLLICFVFQVPYISETMQYFSFSDLFHYHSGIARSYNSSIFKIWGITTLFSTVSAPSYIPTNSVWRFPFLDTFSNMGWLPFWYRYSDRLEMISYWNFYLYFLMISDIWHLFVCLLIIYMSSLKKTCLFLILCPHFNWVIHFLILSCMTSFHTLVTNSLSDMPFANIFSYLIGTSTSVSKESAGNAGHPGLIPGLGRSPGEGHGNPLQYSCLKNPMDKWAWQAIGHGIGKSQTGLSD